MEEKKKNFSRKQVTALVLCLALTAGLLWFNTDPNMLIYRRPLLTAAQVDAQLPAILGYSEYTEVSYPSEAHMELAVLPFASCLPVYQQTFVQPSEDTVNGLLNKMIPALEKMYGIDFPTPSFEEDYDYSSDRTCYGAETSAENIHLYTASRAQGAYALWRNSNYKASLEINGAPLYIAPTHTDKQIMQHLSSTVSYLEDIFNADLSAYKIQRDYARNGGKIDGIYVYLYSAQQKIDKTLEKYCGDPTYYTQGEIFLLSFSVAENDPNQFSLKRIRYYDVPESQCTVYAHYNKLSLFDAQLLLYRGYRFMYRYCADCAARQEKSDFFIYNYVSLEYVFGDEDGGFGIPFYVFYKRTPSDQGVEFIKTRIPAVPVSGVEYFFKYQGIHH